MTQLVSTGKIYDPEIAAPAHHPAPELLIDYVSGASLPAEAFMIELHLAFCAGCRRSVRVLSTTAGDMLDGLHGESLAPDLFNKTLQMIDREDRAPAPQPMAMPAIPEFARRWPGPIARQVAQGGLRNWRRMPAGFRALRIPLPDAGSRVWVMKAPGGRGPFPHGHRRDEWTVVLEGGFTDESGTYNTGDFAFCGPGDEHTIVAEPGEGCVCVLLVRAPPVYTTWPGKLLAPFISV